MKNFLQRYSSLAKGAAGAVAAMAMSVQTGLADIQAASESLVGNVGAPEAFFDNIGEAINAILTFIFIIAVLLVFLYIVWGGITWITSGGDKGKTEEARNKITAAVVGLLILLASFAVLQLVLNFFTGDGLQDVLNLTAETANE